MAWMCPTCLDWYPPNQPCQSCQPSQARPSQTEGGMDDWARLERRAATDPLCRELVALARMGVPRDQVVLKGLFAALDQRDAARSELLHRLWATPGPPRPDPCCFGLMDPAAPPTVTITTPDQADTPIVAELPRELR